MEAGSQTEEAGDEPRHLVHKVGVCIQKANFSNENNFNQIQYNANDCHNRRMMRLKFYCLIWLLHRVTRVLKYATSVFVYLYNTLNIV